ncbi:MAG: 50S ribosomal protein L32 [Candidatus Levybacteria bacterium RIFCSPLOWO2_01_FULL_39_10]|nr:MAG: 50S ribosomal protein L32 [Candidatus Levybacteria bacterium RIFCSPLOWO2_01_FULL_39_10]
MPQEPKRRHSRARRGKRRASIKLFIPNAILCPNCASMILPHSICKNCGYYRGKEYVSHKKPEKQEVQTSA